MGDYSKNNERVVVEKHILKETTKETENIDSLMDKFSNLLDSKLKNINNVSYQGVSSNAIIEDDFDSSKTLEKMADSMIVSKSSKDANFENLGGVAKTKKDKNATDSTIDLLSNLDN